MFVFACCFEWTREIVHLQETNSCEPLMTHSTSTYGTQDNQDSSIKLKTSIKRLTWIKRRRLENQTLKNAHYNSDYMLLFCRGRLGNLQSFKTHVQSCCFCLLNIFVSPRPHVLKVPNISDVTLFKTTLYSCFNSGQK